MEGVNMATDYTPYIRDEERKMESYDRDEAALQQQDADIKRRMADLSQKKADTQRRISDYEQRQADEKAREAAVTTSGGGGIFG